MLFEGFIFLLAATAARGLQCKDHDGEDVDWFYVYKFPRMSKLRHDNEFLRQGVGYAYLTSKSPDANWTYAARGIDDPESILGKTLAPLYDWSHFFGTFHVMYNDQPPVKSSHSREGHTKGVLFGDLQTAVWLVHSIPKFPLPPVNLPHHRPHRPHKKNANRGKVILNSYEFPERETASGHVVVCVSIPTSATSQLGDVFERTDPRIYSAKLLIEHEEVKGFEFLQRESKRDRPIDVHEAKIKSVAEKEFTIFAKPEKYRKDMYSGVIAPRIEDTIYVQTRKYFAAPTLPPYCGSEYNVNDVISAQVYLSNEDFRVDFNAASDHSKWAVSNATETVCVADHDRIIWHSKRGGAAICTRDPDIWNKFYNVVAEVVKCPTTTS